MQAGLGGWGSLREGSQLSQGFANIKVKTRYSHDLRARGFSDFCSSKARVLAPGPSC